jgi:hypothetical protein
MKRSFALGLTALTLSLAAAVGTSLPALAKATLAEGEVDLVPVPREFVQGPLTTVRGEVEIRDTGSALIVRGEAENMDPAKTYISLAYTTPAAGPTACLPGPPLTFNQMFLGTWQVDSDGRGTLQATKTAAGNTSPTPAVLAPFFTFATGGASLSGPGSYFRLTPAVTSVSIREAAFGTVQFAPGVSFTGLLPDRIDCGALHVEPAD